MRPPPTQTELGQGSKSSYEHVWKLRLCELRVSCSLLRTDRVADRPPQKTGVFSGEVPTVPFAETPGPPSAELSWFK